MSMQLIPSHWVVRRSTPFFTRENVPQALLSHHNTAAGVFGQLCVMEGTVTYHGFADEQAEEPEVSLVIRAGEFPISPCSTAAKGENGWGPIRVNGPLCPCRSK